MKRTLLFLSVILLSSLKAMAAEPYALLSENNTKLTFYYGTKPANGMSVGPFTFYGVRGWHSAAATITSVEFYASMANCENITSTAYWFYGLDKLTTITGIDNLNTANVIDMSFMFRNCSSLTSLVLSGFDTDNVTDMMCMFDECSSLTSLDVSGFDTGSVKSMSGMFSGCSALTSLDVSGFDTGSVTDMSGMFADCSSLTSLDLSGFNTGRVKYMGNMFIGCSSLNSLDLSGFNTGNVTDMPAMFYGCSSLTSLDVSRFNTGKVTDMGSMFRDCSSLKTIYCYDTWTPTTSSSYMFSGCTSLVGGDGTHYSADHVTAAYAHPNDGGYFTMKPEPYALLSDNNTKLTFYYGTKPTSGMSVGPFTNDSGRGWNSVASTITTVEFHESMANCNTITSTRCWFYNLEKLTTITGIENLKTANVTDMSFMFYCCRSLTSLDLRGFDTGNVTSMRFMFCSCFGLTSLDVSKFDTGKVTNMSSMFEGCSSLTSLDVSEFDTDNVTDMGAMFSYCFSLTSLDVSGFKTGNVTNMLGMFSDCSSLTSLDLSGFNTSNVENMAYMFRDCSSLTSLDVSGFDTGKVTNMENMLSLCSSLTSLNLNGFNTGNVTTMADMFWDCSSLTSLNLSGFNTSNVENMAYMFRDCSSLTSLDVSGFDTGSVTKMDGMFLNCSSLTSLDVSGFATDNVTNMSQMFYNCSNLTSLDVSKFKTSRVTDMSQMFSNCSSLTSLDVSGFDTGNVTNMSYMFKNCSSLTSLDVSGFDTGNVENMAYMFYDCSSLKTIYSYDIWNQNTPSQGMFTGCTSLVGGDGTHYSADHVTAAYAHPYARGYFSKKTYALLSNNNKTLTFYYGVKPDDGIDVKPFVNNTDPEWYAFRRDITTVKFDYSMENCGNTISTAFWFYDFQNLTTFNGLDRLNTANVEDMQFMFYGFCSMPNLDLRSFDTRNVQNFRGLFKGSSGIQSLDLSSFDTGNATNMEGMFQGCSGLISLNLMNFNTENVTTMMYMFNNCTSLQTIYCYDTWNPNTSSRGMFSGCTSLVGGDGTHYSADHVTAAYAHPNESGYFTKKPLPYAVLSDDHTTLTFYYDKEIKSRSGMDIGPFESSDKRGWHDSSATITTVEFDASMGSCSNITSTAFWFSKFSNLTTITGLDNLKTTNVEDMEYMFSECKKLNSLDLRTFDTRNVKSFEGFLYYCFDLQSIDLSSFDTRNVLSMEKMFRDCHCLTSLDLRGFNTNKVGYMAEMFYSCFQLTTIFCNNSWGSSEGGRDMFSNCVKLKGGSGFSYSVSCTNARYANPYNNGYFTKKQIILGDVNDDGNVTPADAIMILYHYFGVNQNGFHRLAADVNSDGNITPADAIETLYIYFGAGSHNGARAARLATVDARNPE